MELKEQSSFNTPATSTQGVCFDGTHYYVTDTNTNYGKIYKYTSNGTLVATRNCTSDGSNFHLGDLCVKDGVLYVTCSDYPATPYNGNVKEYNASDLSYRNVEYQIGANTVGEGIDYDGSNFWTFDNDNTIRKWDTGFTIPTTYTLDIEPSAFTSSHGIQGGKFFDGSLYVNVHEGGIPSTFMRYELDGTEFKLKECIPRPKWCSQGFDIKPDGTFVLGRRGYKTGKPLGIDDGVVLASLVPYDYRQNSLYIDSENAETGYSGTAYGENTALACSIPVKKWDLIEVIIQGNFRVTGGSMRAYVDVSGSSDVDALPVNNFVTRTMRTATTSTEGESLSQVRHFIAQDSGKLTFAMWWRQQTSGSVYGKDRSISARVIGIYQD